MVRSKGALLSTDITPSIDNNIAPTPIVLKKRAMSLVLTPYYGSYTPPTILLYISSNL